MVRMVLQLGTNLQDLQDRGGESMAVGLVSTLHFGGGVSLFGFCRSIRIALTVLFCGAVHFYCWG